MRYIGKDVVTRGSALVLDREEAWRLLRPRARQGIRKAERAGVHVTESRDLGLMRALRCDPAALPGRLGREQRLFAAWLDHALIGALIITPVSPNTLFCRYGVTNGLGRSVEANACLLWHVVQLYHGHPTWRFLDVGVSFRHEKQHYFQKYCTHSYPIIFNPPDEGALPRINVNPFDWSHVREAAPVHPAPELDAGVERHMGRPFTWTPNGREALRVALRALELRPDDVVTIFPSLKTRYVSSGVTDTIEEVCRWSLRAEAATRALLIIHEWGVPHPETEALCSMGWPVIEDCSSSMTSTVRGRPIGRFGAYAIFSLPKVFPMQHGGLLAGAKFEDHELRDRFGCLDTAKRAKVRAELARWWGGMEEAAERRRENWAYLENLFRMTGFEPFFPRAGEVTPGAFMVRLNGRFPPAAVRERMARFGIECGIYHGENAVFLPCHQMLERAELDYIFAAFRGMVNPCHSYMRPGEEKTAPAPSRAAGHDRVEIVDLAEAAELLGAGLRVRS